jgi:hypothetical protein
MYAHKNVRKIPKIYIHSFMQILCPIATVHICIMFTQKIYRKCNCVLPRHEIVQTPARILPNILWCGHSQGPFLNAVQCIDVRDKVNNVFVLSG